VTERMNERTGQWENIMPSFADTVRWQRQTNERDKHNDNSSLKFVVMKTE